MTLDSAPMQARGWSDQVRDWAELVRVPNTFTTIADILAGFAIAANAFAFSVELVLAALASICLYWAGMILNDVNDVEKDKQTNRRRPLSDGRISVPAARRAGYGLLILAVVLVIPFSAGHFTKWTSWDSVIAAVLLAVCVLLYDSPLKATAVGPVLMGLCRGFNLLLGLSIGANLFEVDWAGQPFWYLAPIAHTVYVAGFTTAARREAELSLRWQLLLGWIVAVIGIGLWMLVPWSAVGHRVMYLDPKTWYPLLVALLCFPWLRRVFASVAAPQPSTVQLAIKQSIITLIFLDAAAALQFGGTTAGISVCILVIPMTVLGLRFRST